MVVPYNICIMFYITMFQQKYMYVNVYIQYDMVYKSQDLS